MSVYTGIGRAAQCRPVEWLRLAVIAGLVLWGRAAEAAPDGTPSVPQPALAAGSLGLYDATWFRAGTGASFTSEPKAAFWYFRDDVVAHASAPAAVMTDDTEQDVQGDIRRWALTGELRSPAVPFLVWIGSPDRIEQALLAPDGATLEIAGGRRLTFTVVPKIGSNRSYFNAASIAYLNGKSLRMRGTAAADGTSFQARTIWPEDWRLAPSPVQPLRPGESLASLIEAEGGGAAAPYATRVLWERTAGAAAASERRPVLGFVLNGAQGDDDEAHGGHFAVLTGWLGPDRGIGDWMVNNFYNLGTVSEKGIIASMLPLDAYMTDLNSGQAWYRPSYLLVAILDDPAPANQFQSAMVRVFERFYRQHVEYDHARMNCAGISVDTLAGLGWNYPTLGPTSYPKALAGYFYSSATDRDFSAGRKTFHYLTEERVRLYPRAAFETLGQDLLTMATSPARPSTPYEKGLAEHVQAIVFVRIPQLPSSRAMGSFPVGSFDAYMARVPSDRKDWKIVPVDSRELPTELRDRPKRESAVSDAAVGWLALSALAITAATPIALWRRSRRRHRGHGPH